MTTQRQLTHSQNDTIAAGVALALAQQKGKPISCFPRSNCQLLLAYSFSQPTAAVARDSQRGSFGRKPTVAICGLENGGGATRIRN
jgi:hypothetical protein